MRSITGSSSVKMTGDLDLDLEPELEVRDSPLAEREWCDWEDREDEEVGDVGSGGRRWPVASTWGFS